MHDRHTIDLLTLVPGEIDIIEFVNNLANNEVTLHTSPGCTVAGADETGTLVSSDCGVCSASDSSDIVANSISRPEAATLDAQSLPLRREAQDPASMPTEEGCMQWNGHPQPFGCGSSHVIQSRPRSIQELQTLALSESRRPISKVNAI